MKKCDIVTIGLRLVAVFVLIKSIAVFHAVGRLASNLFGSIGNQDSFGREVTMGTLFLGLALLVCSVLLLVLSGKLGRYLARPNPDEPVQIASSLHDVQAAAFAVFGTYIAIMSIPALFTAARQLRYFHVIDGCWARIGEAVSLFGAGVLQLALGIGLFFGSRKLSNIWRRYTAPRPIR